MSNKWYSHLKYQDFGNQHVLATFFDGTIVAGSVCYDSIDEDQCSAYTKGECTGFVCMATNINVVQGGSLSHMPAYMPILVCAEDGQWHPVTGVKSIDLVWDERDWDRIGLDDIESIDALVVSGRIYELVSHKPDCGLWQLRVPGEKHTARVSTAMISCALRRKVGAAEEHESSGPFESLVQYLMPKIPVSDGRAA
ncbi:hypothetical protein [Bifidobacterium asteroides]|uniref:hypothetical protein n=1 Tax=Bifidobacterium asteroides TaxID=1684 RepID=UPI0027416FAC|nr:hypothetical protein [Bifidobacterium asteroides]WLT10245.1 hypothetical protein RAM15_05890 [Bifidobacterium asteroides]